MLLNVNPVFLSPRHLFTTEDAVELRLRHFGMKLKENKKIRRKKYKKYLWKLKVIILQLLVCNYLQELHKMVTTCSLYLESPHVLGQVPENDN